MMTRIAAGALALALLVPGTLPLCAQEQRADPPRPAQQLVDEALATARAQQKHVLVYFTASWCGWCHRFQKFLEDPVVGKLMADQFVTVQLTAQEAAAKKALENPGADALLKQMGSTGGIPFYFMLDETGKKLGDANGLPDGGNIGHPYTPEEIRAFDALLARTAPGMTAAQRAQIGTYLTRVAQGGGES